MKNKTLVITSIAHRLSLPYFCFKWYFSLCRLIDPSTESRIWLKRGITLRPINHTIGLINIFIPTGSSATVADWSAQLLSGREEESERNPLNRKKKKKVDPWKCQKRVFWAFVTCCPVGAEPSSRPTAAPRAAAASAGKIHQFLTHFNS